MAERYEVRDAVAADAHAIARVHVDAWHETYTGLLPDAVLAGITYAERERQWDATFTREEPCIYVAEGTDGIVGFAAGGPNRDPADTAAYPGELYAIYVLASHQRRGAGRALFARVQTALRRRALEPFILWVLDRNPACAFYERLQGRRVVTQPAEIRGAKIVEHGYAWGLP